MQCSNPFDEQKTMQVLHFLDNGTAAKFSFYPLCSFGFFLEKGNANKRLDVFILHFDQPGVTYRYL